MLDKESTYKYYEQWFEDILKPYLKLGYGHLRWIKARNLKLKTSGNRIAWDKKFTDEYIIESSKDKTILAKDVEARGNFFPIFIHDELTVMLGHHRVEAMKLYNEEYKFPCVVLDSKHFQERKDKVKYEYKNPEELDSLIEYLVPAGVKIPKDARMDEYIIVKINKRKFNTDKEYVKLKIENYRDMIDAIKLVPHWLNSHIYYLDKKEGFTPFKGISSEEAFQRWIS